MMWKFLKACYDGEDGVFDINIFDYNWVPTGRCVEVLDPIYNQKHTFKVYNIDIEEKQVTFAAGEFSNGVYGFYVRE